MTDERYKAAIETMMDVAREERTNYDEYLTQQEAAAELGVHVETIRRYVKSGQLPALTSGPRRNGRRLVRIKRGDLRQIGSAERTERNALELKLTDRLLTLARDLHRLANNADAHTKAQMVEKLHAYANAIESELLIIT